MVLHVQTCCAHFAAPLHRGKHAQSMSALHTYALRHLRTQHTYTHMCTPSTPLVQDMSSVRLNEMSCNPAYYPGQLKAVGFAWRIRQLHSFMIARLEKT